jgi:hypothetical protein
MSLGTEGTFYAVNLDFCELVGRHTGEMISNRLLEVLKDYGIEKQVLTITGDNASNNDSGMEKFATLLHLGKTTYPKDDEVQIRCFAHVLNLCCQGNALFSSNELMNLDYLS